LRDENSGHAEPPDNPPRVPAAGLPVVRGGIARDQHVKLPGVADATAASEMNAPD
jgi:hypothetical protein